MEILFICLYERKGSSIISGVACYQIQKTKTDIMVISTHIPHTFYEQIFLGVDIL